MRALSEIFTRLGMHVENGLYIRDNENWKGMLPARFEWLFINKLTPDAFFCIENKPIILFYDSPQNKKDLFQRIWNFNETPIVIINEIDTISIFNGLSYLKDESRLDILENEKKLDAFSYFELVTGRTLKTYEKKFQYQKRVDYKLLENIKSARELLCKKYKIDSFLANALIGKCIFIRYLVDRKVRINFDGELRTWTNSELCQLLENRERAILFLNYLREHFNGEAFLIEDSQIENISREVFGVLSHLMSGVDIATGQTNLFDIYDFSIIPVEFISNVYEYFIGEENQSKKGAYYTPLFLVDYMVSETVEKFLLENPGEYNCKVLDPACGSGIFLVESLRRMIQNYQKINKIAISQGADYKEIIRKIAENNIFGVDEDANAINVAIFSIYLTLLDYQEPKEIENFKFPKLLNKNFFTNDFFNLEADFNNRFARIDFNFILGNPPWKRGSNKNAFFLKYIDERKKKESIDFKGNPHPAISNKEIAQAFVLRTSDFSCSQTKCALIITSKMLYNLNANNFRSYLLHNYFIDKVFELAPVRREIFDRSNDPSIAPAAILFFHFAHARVTDTNIVQHIALKPSRFFSLFKLFTLQKDDFKQVVQSRLKEYDWLWKLLVYGSYLDFNFIKRLKEEYKTIGSIIYDNDDFLVKQGLKRKDGNKKIDVQEIVGWDFLDTNQKELKPFFIEPKHKKWEQKDVGYIYRDSNRKIFKELFCPPCTIVRDGLTSSFLAVSSRIKSPVVFTDTITAIKPLRKDTEEKLANIVGLLNSAFYGYYTIITASVAGIERERSHDEEKFNFPYTNNSVITDYVKRIETISDRLFEEKQKTLNLHIQILEDEKKELIKALDEEVYQVFELDETERTLVDYTVNVTIPLVMKHKGYEQKLFSPLPFKSSFLEDYVNIFLDRFKNSFRGKYLEATIWHTNYIIGVFFKVVPIDVPPIKWQAKENSEFIKKIISISSVKITENLFIQKDIRGFEKDGFYIFKPNETKLWHRAIGYLDVAEFTNAILKTGEKAYHG